jgi:arylsulfatase A-like enzyme
MHGVTRRRHRHRDAEAQGDMDVDDNTIVVFTTDNGTEVLT